MKKIMIVTLLSLSACSPNADVKCSGFDCNAESKTSSYSYTYEFSDNGCATGKISASTQEQKCNNLKNDSLNKYCASSIRYETFKSECPGQSWN